MFPAAPLLRLVSAIPVTFAVVIASSPKVSKKSPIRKKRIVSGYFALMEVYCFINGVCFSSAILASLGMDRCSHQYEQSYENNFYLRYFLCVLCGKERGITTEVHRVRTEVRRECHIFAS